MRKHLIRPPAEALATQVRAGLSPGCSTSDPTPCYCVERKVAEDGQVLGPPPGTWETQMEFEPPAFCSAQSGCRNHLWNEPGDGELSLFLSVSPILPFK